MKKREIQAGETRRKILQAALLILGTKGQQGFTASALCQEAGISKGNLYHHFKSLDEVPFCAMEIFIEEFEVLIPTDKFRSPQKYLCVVGSALLDYIKQHEQLFTAYLFYYEKALVDENYKGMMQKMMNSYMQYIEDALSRFYPKRVIGKDYWDRAVLDLAIMLDCMYLYLLILGDEERFKKMWHYHAQLITDDLSQRVKNRK
ncbi:MAG: TetR/AcrR family transcriptional regulator [Bacteriovoracaceae bacterium]|nr:TetR/AcrR family transcriptional regulator [Bacteriovoracaceae bacterium]